MLYLERRVSPGWRLNHLIGIPIQTTKLLNRTHLPLANWVKLASQIISDLRILIGWSSRFCEPWYFSFNIHNSLSQLGCSVNVQDYFGDLGLWFEVWKWWDRSPLMIFCLRSFPIFCCWNLKFGKELAQVQHGLVQLVKIVQDGVKQSGKLGEKKSRQKNAFFPQQR